MLYLVALPPTDSVTEGYLPAAARLGLDVTLLTDAPDAHRRAYAHCGGPSWPRLDIVDCQVRDFREVIAGISARDRRPEAVFTNSDHLQVQVALTADWFGLPGKDWRAALRTKNKALLRRALAEAGAERVWSTELTHAWDGGEPPHYPCVVKPREGVAGEDSALVHDREQLVRHCRKVRSRRPGLPLVAEEYLPGPLHTLETLGDGHTLHVLGSFRDTLAPLPYFTLRRSDLLPAPSRPHAEQVVDRLRALGVAFGACHTEYVVQGDRIRIIEVNYRTIGSRGDLDLADALGIPLFEHVLRTHLGERLPADLGVRSPRRLRIEYVSAGRGGILKAAPAATECEREGVRLAYRPLREIGEEHPLYHSDRDFLGVLVATGADEQRVDRAVAAFLAARRWEIA
ncbi:acetyl-CoA carboxylase biotin carboxylase subunit family protein [Streptomyces sp. NPDC001407]|uniref:ATP-grasp domain-containing protein n=1 Tax=Streptomyces sp. NPDC001407 TaxID=3364573 RepID=UPI0036C87318